MKLPKLPSYLAVCALLIAGCGGAPEGTSPDSEASSERRFLSFGTAPAGGAFFVVGGALAEVADAHGPGWQVTAEATKGSRENIRRLDQGELDFALANSAISYFAVRGESGWDRAYELRAVATLAPNVALFVAPQNAGVTTIGDLRGKRVVVGPAGAGFEMFVGPLLAAHDVGFDDFTMLHNSQLGAVDLLADGAAAAAFLGGAVPTASITQAARSMDLVYVPLDPAARQSLLADYPFFAPATIPADTYAGLEADYDGLDVGSMHLITSAAADQDLVYELTKTIWEHRDEVVARHPAGRAINEKNAVRSTGTPFHDGAVRFYREIGIWPAASDGPAADAAETPHE